MTKPISPKEAKELHTKGVPSVVFEAVNELIAKEFNGSSFTLLQKEVIRAIQKYEPSISESKMYSENYLDIEDHYKKAGWNVVYDEPAYCESYEPSWRFTPKKG